MEFNNQTKTWSRQWPFVRIHSRNFKMGRKDAPTGEGKKCGCRGPENYDAIVLAGLLVFATGGITDLIPKDLKDKADQLLKTGTDKDLDDFRKEFAKYIGDRAESLLFGSALRQVPSWVPVDREKKKLDRSYERIREVDKEVFGNLSRSFQSCTDVAVLPWNRFFN
jgi:hypothetical protein